MCPGEESTWCLTARSKADAPGAPLTANVNLLRQMSVQRPRAGGTRIGERRAAAAIE